MPDPNEESKFLGLLDKQSARIAAIIGAVALIFNWVILPIQRVQTQLTNIQIQLNDYKKAMADVATQNVEQDRRLDRQEAQLEQLTK